MRGKMIRVSEGKDAGSFCKEEGDMYKGNV